MARDPECIFCKIIAAQVPSFVVHEDQTTIAFLDSGPLAEGHLLVVPRSHYSRLSEMPPELAGDVCSKLPTLGRALMKVCNAGAYNILCNEGTDAGQAVKHVHFHLIPRRGSDGLGYRWNAGTYQGGRAAEIAVAYQKAIAHHV